MQTKIVSAPGAECGANSGFSSSERDDDEEETFDIFEDDPLEDTSFPLASTISPAPNSSY